MILYAVVAHAARLDFRLMPASAVSNEWTQHGHDAARTNYTPDTVALPWRWQWSWNGSDAAGRVVSGKMKLPRNVQPVTGGGRIYMACGDHGVVAINPANGAELWRKNPGGSIRSTVAYDPVSGALFAYSNNGFLYRIDPANGSTTGSFNTGATSNFPLPPCLIPNRVFVSSGSSVFAVNTATMQPVWTYTAGSVVQTPPAYSTSRDVVIVCTADLNVHAISNATGARRWRTKPSVHRPESPYEYTNGWPVIAERPGLALVRMRIHWDLLWNSGQEFGQSNAAIRAMLEAHPEQQCHFALNLDNGAIPFICNNGQGGYGDGGYMPIGSMPVVKTFADGKQVAYNVIRGDLRYDTRWDSHFGEMMLDDSTTPGLRGGEIRWIRHGNEPGENGFLLTDEQPYVSMAGNHLFGLHWLIGYALRITDRGPSRGTYENMIESENLPWLICSQGACGPCSFSPTHYCAAGLSEDPTCGRGYAGGFYVCYNQGTIHDEYWSEYGTWVVSAGMVLCRTNDGAIACLRTGNPNGVGKMTAAAPLSERPVAASDQPIAGVIVPADALKFAGRTATVQGRAAYLFNNGKTLLIGFAHPHQNHFKAQIPRESWADFIGLGTTMGRDKAQIMREGDTVRVTGTIAWYQGDPVIYVTHPRQIEVVK